MRVFWLLIAVLAVATVVVAVARRREPVFQTATVTATPPAPTSTTPPPQQVRPEPTPPDDATPGVVATTAEESADALARDLLESAWAETPDVLTELAPEFGPEPESKPDPAPASAPARAPEPEPEPPSDPGKTDVAAPLMVEQDDGSVLLDDQFVLRGDGTSENPYRFSWDLLVSASATYQPRAGKEEIPARIQMLHDKHVKITGYLAFPFATQRVDEGLVMLNQWDGCCIGVPPSPFDGIEMRLSKAIDLREGHLIRYGSIEGIFKVDPYLVNKWLVGLYLLEDATIVDEGF